MRKIILLGVFLFIIGCNTIKNKTDDIVKKENEKLSQFIGQPVSELKIVMGIPDKEEKNELGLEVLFYKTKKYGIPCERKFEIDQKNIVISFTSSGCI